MGAAVRQGAERQRLQPVRLSAVLAKHGFDDIGDRRELEWFTQERGVRVGQYGLEDLGNAEFVVDHQDERHPNPHCDARWLAP